jgi:hypothetical protein
MQQAKQMPKDRDPADRQVRGARRGGW